MNFLRDLREYDKDNIPVSFIGFFSVNVTLPRCIRSLTLCNIKQNIRRYSVLDQNNKGMLYLLMTILYILIMRRPTPLSDH